MRSRSSTRVWRRKERGTQAPARERGTVLLMVIGVLALLAIIAVVYASLGQSDRRSSSAYVRSVQVEDITGQFGDYIAGIIGQDVNQVVEEEYPSANNSRTLKRRFHPTWTYPSIELNDNVKSDPPPNGTIYHPVGGGYQPWLAPAEPTWLRFNNGLNWTDPDRQFLDFRDWLTISNVAPNGQFVNLNNLRNNFFAESGIGNDAGGRPRMSKGLTLFDQNGLVYRSGLVQLEDGRSADLNIPWHWTARQRRAARPLNSFAFGNNLPGPGTDEYLANQWMDADGDGIVDSRWFELTGAAGPLAQWVTQNLAQQDKARYFAAVRIVDLAGMTNVSTAMDLLAPPGPLQVSAGDAPLPALFPFGITPADTDLLRRLTLQDAYERYGVGYNQIQQPASAQSPGNYSQYTNLSGTPAAAEVGRSAYAALQWCISLDRVPTGGPRPRGNIPGLDPNFNLFDNPFITPLADRARIYFQSELDPAQIGYSNQSLVYGSNTSTPPDIGFNSRMPFGMAEELELHAFFGVNDPRERSRLEAVLEGRRDTRPTFGVLRSPRALDIERERRGDNRADGQQDDDSLTQQHLDIRHSITTVGSARPLTSLAAPRSFNPDVIGDTEVRVNLLPYLYPKRQITDAALKRLFNYACDALMPYRTPETFENVWDMSRPENRGLHYANSADFAFRSAAHWLVNLIDSVDDDDSTDRDIAGPTCVTLRTVASAPTARSADYPWPQITLNNDSMELAPNRSFVESQLVNIYGIEAQPFFCEVGSYAFWMDMPWDANVSGISGMSTPDDEWTARDPDGPGGPLPPVDGPVTIKNDVLASNPDFLGEIIAFQITNPFDRELYLTRVGTGGPEILYYVEYAGRYFPLAEMDAAADPPALVNADLKLNPGETRVFYATSPRREFNFNQRFELVNGTNSAPVPPLTNFLRDWVNTQFRKNTTVDPVHTTMFDPETGSLVDPEGAGSGEQRLMDLHGEHLSPVATTAQRRVVNLWRVLRAPGQDDQGTNNRKQNDLLADRIRDTATPAIATLFQRLDSANNDEVPGTIAGDDHGSVTPQDNTGLSITLWGAIRRPTNPSNIADHAPKGAMPPWCIEARDDQTYLWGFGPNGTPSPTGSRRFLNKEFDGPPGRGNGADYPGSDTRYKRLGDLVADQARGDGGTKINDQMREKAEDKNGNPILRSQSRKPDNTYRTFNEQAVRIPLTGRDPQGRIWNAGLYKRLGDILLPLAIGPYYDPQLPPVRQRMTLSETLAVAMDYYSPPVNNLYFRAGHTDPSVANPTPANPSRPRLDTGHFVIDNFAPYNDSDRNGAFNPGQNNAKERPLGLGIPIALNLLDKFHLDESGGKARGEIGKTNINTASLMALSALPMLTPDPSADWMTTDLGTTRVKIYNPLTQQADRATTLEAYRDKLDRRTRPKLTPNGSGPGRVFLPSGNSTLEISFRDTVDPLINPWNHDGRRVQTLIPALREDLGFRSPGEVLAAVLRGPIPAGANPVEYRTNSMDAYALDDESFTGQRGIEPNNVMAAGGIAREDSDAVKDDYGEKIAIANAALSSITTRSDTFCVWFVVHGYLPSDVENLSPKDPLIPSVAKRFMMIVDRSNVVKKGDKPRILLFREVPM